jgi:hypothetical protein
MEVQIGINNTRDANLFLRALWAEFRRECGKCAWQYMPHKDGQKKRIFIGFADINRPEGTVEISVTYAERGTIRSISFNHSEDRPVGSESELGGLLQRSVKCAVEKMGKPERQLYSVKVEGLYAPLRYYRGDSFSFEPVSRRRFNLALDVHAFDKTDAEPELVRKLRHVLNILSVETNSAFWPLIAGQVEEDEPLAQPLDKAEVFPADPDWMDHCPVQDGQLLISREGKGLIDMVAEGGPIPDDVGTCLRACNHFHIARKYAAQIIDLVELGEAEHVEENELVMPMSIRNRRLEAAGQVGDAHAEITGALLMSAMEVAAKIGLPKAEACKECGQLRYKISQRVTDLMNKFGGEHLGMISKGYYSQRSQYLHEGTMLSPSNYTGTSIPQLDPSSPSGCLKQTASPDPNLRDYVGFCLRKVLKGIVACGGSL